MNTALPMSACGGRILVVDDEMNARTGLAGVLEGEGYDVEVARDGLDALHKLESFAADLVLTDLRMPGIDGLELTKRLQAYDPRPDVVVMTANTTVTSAVAVMLAGATNYLIKPLNIDELLLVTERALQHQRLRDETTKAQVRVREQLAFTSAMANSLGEGVLAIDLDGTITFINAAGATLLGCNESEAPGRPSTEISHVESCDGLLVECPLHAAIRTGEPVRSDKYTIVRANRSRFFASYSATPIRQDGRVTGAVIAFDDVSERRRDHEDEQFLADAGTRLSASLDSVTMASTVAEVGLPRLGDLCFVDLVSSEGMQRRVECAHTDLVVRSELEEAFGVSPRAPVFARALADVMAIGRSLRSKVEDAWFAPADLAVMRRLGIRSALFVPLTLGARQLGMLTFFTAGGHQHADRDVAVAEKLARHSAVAIEHAQLYKQVRDAIAVRDQTLAIVSHDLRSPLQTIGLATESLRDDDMRASRSTKSFAIDKIQRAADRMDRMIGDLVDFESIATGRLSIVTNPQAVSTIVDESVASVAELAKKRNVKLTATCPADVPSIECDRDRILQAIGNLLGNALKVTRSGDSVSLCATLRDRDVMFSVSDTGPGISTTDQEHLFERYWRSPDASYRGTGLGLAIARGIVEAHHGEIWVESELGRGTTFHLTVPLAEPRSAEPADRQDDSPSAYRHRSSTPADELDAHRSRELPRGHSERGRADAPAQILGRTEGSPQSRT